MRWRCQDFGCYLQRRSDVVMFDGCFPAGISMGNVDGIVELCGHFLMIEFRKPGRPLPIGQGHMFEQLVATGYFTVFVVFALEQHVQSWTVFTRRGQHHEEGDVMALREAVAAWSQAHDPRPVRLGPVPHPLA
jgi:hypothetical protein